MSTPRHLDRPDQVERIDICVDGRTWAALRAVPHAVDAPGPAPTVLLAHGFTGSKEDFTPLLPALADHGYTAVAIDHVGQHESPHAGGALSIEDFAQDLVRIVGALDTEQVHLVGHSFGGLAARRAALASPESFASLTLLNSGPSAVMDPAQQQALLAFIGAMRAGMVDTVWAYMESERRTADPTLDDAIAGFLEDRFRSGHVESHAAIAQALLDEDDLVAQLSDLPLTIHVAYGVDDDVWPEAVQQDMATRLGRPAHPIQGAGHSPAIDEPRLTASTLHHAWTSPASSVVP